MKTHVMHDTYIAPVEITGNGGTWNFAIDSSVVSTATDGPGVNGIHEADGLKNNSIIVHGTAYAPHGSAVVSGGTNTAITLARDAVIYGFNGVNVQGANVHVINRGEIFSTRESYGMVMSSEGGHIENFGSIRVGTYGIENYAANGVVINEKGGYIQASVAAVHLAAPEGSHDRLENYGTLSGRLDCGSGVDTIVNRGHISGTIYLGSGNDTFDNRGGVVQQPVQGGGGNDTLITDSKNAILQEDGGEGRDTVKSTVSYTLAPNVERLVLIGSANVDGKGSDMDNSLIGNTGNNILKGLAGDDALDGGKGNDKLLGGAGGDTFGFATGYGKDEIKDFDVVEGDSIYLHNWKAIDTFMHLRAHAQDNGENVWITAGTDTLVIDHMHKADLQARDFQF